MYSHQHQRLWAVAEPTRESPAGVYLATLAPIGRRSMRVQLRRVLQVLGKRKTVEGFDWARLRYADVIRVRAKLVEQGRSPHSVNLALSAVRGTMKCAFHLGQINAEQLLRLQAVRRLPVDATPRGRSLSRAQVKQLLAVCRRDRTPRGIRDGAVLALLISTGLRRAEAAALTLADYDAERGVIRTRTAKRNRHRDCPLVQAARRRVDRWLRLRGASSGPLFCRIDKAGNLGRRPLSSQAIYDIAKGRAAAAGIGLVTPHDLRRTFVTSLLTATGDINLVRGLVGHADIETTARYDLRTHNALSYIEKSKIL